MFGSGFDTVVEARGHDSFSAQWSVEIITAG